MHTRLCTHVGSLGGVFAFSSCSFCGGVLAFSGDALPFLADSAPSRDCPSFSSNLLGSCVARTVKQKGQIWRQGPRVADTVSNTITQGVAATADHHRHKHRVDSSKLLSQTPTSTQLSVTYIPGAVQAVEVLELRGRLVGLVDGEAIAARQVVLTILAERRPRARRRPRRLLQNERLRRCKQTVIRTRTCTCILSCGERSKVQHRTAAST